MPRITTDLREMTFTAAHDIVRLTDWHATIPEDVFRVACDHSVCFGALAEEPTPGWPHALVAFARTVTDHATYAYLMDVIVHPAWRGRGLARALVLATLEQPGFQNLRRYALLSRDAPGLYRKLGFIDGDPGVTYLEIRQNLWGRAH